MGNKPSFQLVIPRRCTGAIFNLFCPQQGSIKHKQDPLRLGECRALCELVSAPSAGVAHEQSGRGGVGKGLRVGERRNTLEKGRDKEKQSSSISDLSEEDLTGEMSRD